VAGEIKKPIAKPVAKKKAPAKPRSKKEPSGVDTRFKPGQSGNPKGRTPGSHSKKTVAQAKFIELMDKVVDFEAKDGKKKSMAFFDGFLELMMTEAMNPKSFAFEFLAERFFDKKILTDLDRVHSKSLRADRDFQQFRIVKRAFPMQQRVLMAFLGGCRDIVLMCGRRAGKTAVAILLAVLCLLSGDKEKPSRVLIIGLTFGRAQAHYWQGIQDVLNDLGVEFDANKTEGRITIVESGAFLQISGNSNEDERQKMRGDWWSLVVVDESQSQKKLYSLLEDIIYPMLVDVKGALLLAGSGPRIPGTAFETLFGKESQSGLRLNWDMSANPNIMDYETALKEARDKYGYAEDDPTYLREWRGLIAYDTEAMVVKPSDKNYFTDEELREWIVAQPPDSIRFSAGLDYGTSAYDAFEIQMYSEGVAEEVFAVYEYKEHGTGIEVLANAIKYGLEYVKNDPLFEGIYNKDMLIWADTNEQRTSMDLRAQYGLPVVNAIKQDAELAVQLLQRDCRSERRRWRRGSPFDDEGKRTVFKRIDMEGKPSMITKEIDDDVYHPDSMKAAIYASRQRWINQGDGFHEDRAKELETRTITEAEKKNKKTAQEMRGNLF
jgi:hypothetical protein